MVISDFAYLNTHLFYLIKFLFYRVTYIVFLKYQVILSSTFTVSCNVPDANLPDNFQCSNGFNFGSSCTFHCEESMVNRTIISYVCERNGSWSNTDDRKFYDILPDCSGNYHYPTYITLWDSTRIIWDMAMVKGVTFSHNHISQLIYQLRMKPEDMVKKCIHQIVRIA